MILQIVTRVLLFVAVVVLSMLTADPAHSLIINTFHYQTPSGFFDIGGGADWELALAITILFWGGIIFGALGKKIDYGFMALIVAFAAWEFLGTNNVTSEMYAAPVAALVVGNIIGYLLKLGHKKWFKSS